MAKPYIDRNGIEIETFEEIFDDLIDGYKNIYGSDINIDQDTADGQRIGIEAKLALDLQASALQLYNSFDPDFAVGNQINKLAKISGTIRKFGTKSSVDITIVNSIDVYLDETFTITDEANQNWVIGDAVTLTAGTSTVKFYAENFGSIEALSGTINKFNTIVLGVDSVNNLQNADVGVDEESDKDFRRRRNESLQNPSYSTVGSIYSKVLNLSDVIDAKVFENDTSITDSNGLEAKSIWVIVEGGQEEDIAEILAKQKTVGCAFKGAVEATYNEEIELVDESIRIISTLVKFDRPVVTPAYIKIDVKRKFPNDEIDFELIKKGIIEKTYTINEDVVATELYSYAYLNSQNFIATNLTVSKDNITFEPDTIEALAQEKFTLSLDNIEVTEVF